MYSKPYHGLCWFLASALVFVGSALAQQAAKQINQSHYRDTFAVGSKNNKIKINVRNIASLASPDYRPAPSYPLQWVEITSIEPKVARIEPGEDQDFIVTFNVSASAPLGGGEGVTIFFQMGQGAVVHRHDLVIDFASRGVLNPAVAPPELDPVEIEETFEADTTGNGVVFRVRNTTAHAIKQLKLRPQLSAKYLIRESINPPAVDLEPGAEAEIIASFAVRKDAPDGEQDVINFHFEADTPLPVPLNHYRLIANIKADPSEQTAKCNSAVESGGDAGGGVAVDLGGFVGKAGFGWTMYRVKDQMDVTIGGTTKTTGCVSGSGTMELDIPPGAATAKVTVVPNCEKTSGTRWVFRFECPIKSNVTADGRGNTLTAGSGSSGTTGVGAIAAATPSLSGRPASPQPPRTGSGQTPPQQGGGATSPPQVNGASAPPPTPQSTTGTVRPQSAGSTSADREPNNRAAVAIPTSPSGVITGTLEKAGDVDFFALDTNIGGEWEVTVQGASAGTAIGLGVHPAAGGNWLPDQSGKDDGKLIVDIKRPGRYVLRVNAAKALPPNTRYTIVKRFRPTPDGHEPNDTAAISKPTHLNAVIVGAIHPAREADFFVVDVKQPGAWTIDIIAKPKLLSVGLGVHPASGGNWLPDQEPKGDNRLVVDIKWPGKYVLRVTDTNNARSIDPYILHASFQPSPETAEPNDKASLAKTLLHSQAITGTLLPARDADYWAIDVRRHGRWEIAVTSKPADLDIGLGVHSAAGGNWLQDLSAKNDDKLVVDLPRPGRYVLRVVETKGRRSAEPYRLRQSFTQSPDQFEPNNHAANASPVSATATLTGALLPSGDADHYIIDVKRSGQWDVAITQSPPNLKLGLGVYAAAGGNWLPDQSPKSEQRLTVDLKWPGKYILKVTETARQSAITAYRLATNFTPAPDAYEPNDTAALARRIPPSGSITGAILPVRDVDHFLVNFSAKSSWTVSVEKQPAGANIALGVYPATGGNWLPDKSPKGDRKLVVDIPKPGKYILRVTDKNNRRSVAPYRLSTGLN